MAKEDFYQEIDDEITFNIINQDVLDRLKQDGEISVPKKKIDVPKDKRWNKKQMTSKILQGLESGSSIADIAEAMKAVIGNNEVSAIRNTRTMTTSAENNGRLDSYKNLANQGVVMKKEWIATPDDRTRPTHLALDGEEIDLDKVFSNGCRFPGDSKGPAEEVWMCRCAMGTHIVGFRRADGSISKVDYERDDTLHDKQMKLEKKQRKQKQKAKSVIPVVNGEDISATWQRRSDEFDFEIDDVINAQGFDGLPRVVNAEEFDRYVEESNFIAQRTYSAPDQEMLDAYRQQLYEGKWYVDCSTGGAAYGQGMYCAGNYKGVLTEDIMQEMEDYAGIRKYYINGKSMSDNTAIHKIAEKYAEDNGVRKIEARKVIRSEFNSGLTIEELCKKYNVDFKKGQSFVETITFTKDAKIAKYDDIKKMFDNDSNKKVKDLGSYAVLKGYDAIRTTAGTSGADTIILNRTKVIFKGE